MEKKYFSAKEISQYTGIALSTIYEWVAKGLLPAIKIGRKVIFDREVIDSHLRKLGCKAKRKKDNLGESDESFEFSC